MTPPFYIGQPVICIDPKWGDGSLDRFVTLPVRGRIYHVRDIFQIVAVRREGPTWWLHLDELVNGPTAPGAEEPCFEAKNYRALGEGKSDISFAHEILREVTVKVDA
jgi:hypothetical protein